ncbi:unnamed protein product [Rotaria sp. Silwood1]|nr:unnamed protein product [Rotaria sp. Silwood1]
MNPKEVRVKDREKNVVEDEKKLKAEKEKTEQALKEEKNKVDQAKSELAGKEKKIESLENDLTSKIEKVAEKEKEIESLKEETVNVISEQKDRLQRISGLTQEEAKKELFESLLQQVKLDSAQKLQEVRDETKLEANRIAKNLIIQSIQRTASDHSVETTVSVLQITSDELKGRIIGKEGRNIRAFEAATGVDIIVDDTPEAIIISGAVKYIIDNNISSINEIPKDYVTDFLTELVVHEVGHTLGLRHNFKASSAYTFEEIRNPEFTNQWGNGSSVMDYNAANISPPGMPQGTYWTPTIGMYDYFAIEYGYKNFPNIKKADDEVPYLIAIASKSSDPHLVYGTDEDVANSFFGPTSLDPLTQIFDLGSSPLKYAKDKPVIASINGVAAGAGLSLALACDYRIAVESATLIEVFINVGLVPDSGSSFYLLKILGYAKAFELCATGDKVTAKEAKELGLINKMVSNAALLKKITEQVANNFASKPTFAIGSNPNQFAEIAANLFVGLGFLANSRSDETEADDYSIKYLRSSQYYPGGIMFFFNKIRQEEIKKGSTPGGLERLLATHPLAQDRIDNAYQDLSKIVPRPDSTKGLFPERYQEIKAKLQ